MEYILKYKIPQYSPDIIDIDHDYRQEREEHKEHDVNHFMRALNKTEQWHFIQESKPDEIKRNSPQPDYIYRDNDRNKVMAIEYSWMYYSEEQHKKDVNVVLRDQFILDSISATPEEFADRVKNFVVDKLSKGQLTQNETCERLLLFRNRWTEALPMEEEDFYKYLKSVVDELQEYRKQFNCDLCYMLHYENIIKLF